MFMSAKSYRYLESILLIISFLSGLYLVINLPANIDVYCLVPYVFLLFSALCLIFEKYKANQKIRVRMTILFIGIFLTTLLFAAEGNPVDNSYSYGPLVAFAAGFVGLVEFLIIGGAIIYSSIKEKKNLEKSENEKPQEIESIPDYKLKDRRIPKGYFNYRDFQLFSSLLILAIAVGVAICVSLIDVNFIAAIAGSIGEIILSFIIVGISINKKQIKPFLDYEKTLNIDVLVVNCNEILKRNIHKDTANFIYLMLCNYYLDIDEKKSNEYFEKVFEPKNADQIFIYDQVVLEHLKLDKEAYLKRFEAIICRPEYSAVKMYAKKLQEIKENYLTTLSGESDIPLEKRFNINTKNKLINANNTAMLIQTYCARKDYDKASKLIATFKHKYPELIRLNEIFENIEFDNQ